MSERAIVFVHAHPDDECLSTGGTIARYTSEGVRVCLITCTNGELGEIADVPELGTHDQIAARLGEVRLDELALACNELGITDLRTLGYHDSGMAGTEGNDDPKAFVNQDLDEVVSKVASIYREVRPDAVVTYNEFGGYGHPDHIRAHEAAVLAIEAAADPSFEIPGEPHRVEKLYYTAFSRRAMIAMRDRYGNDEQAKRFFSEENINRIATDDDQITTIVDVAPFIGPKFSSIRAHRTQLGTTSRWLELGEQEATEIYGRESFVRIRPTGAEAGSEDDLLSGIS